MGDRPSLVSALGDLALPGSYARFSSVTLDAQRVVHKAWKPHPDDERDVRDAAESVERGELLSPEASEAFLRWIEGSDDESWRGESG
jgi:hypothetical protein